MKALNKVLLVVIFIIAIALSLSKPNNAFAATSPTLNALSGYSVLGGAGVTCTGATTTTGAVGVSPGTSITGFPSPCTAGGGTQSNNASAIAAQAEALTTFSTLDQTCDQSFGAVDLTATFPSGVGPGVYCSTSSFSLTGNLNLTGSGVWIFKSVSTIITSPGSSVTGGDACNIWWRVGSSATLDTTTAFKGNIFALNGTTALNAGATLDGRVIGLAANTVTLSANTISGPTCTAASSSSSSSSSSSGSGSSSGSSPSVVCPTLSCVTPLIIESRRISPTSIFLSWGPYTGINTFKVSYGLTNGSWLYSTTVIGFNTTINNLPANLPIWILINPTDFCTVGSCGVARLVGGPLLPNTGLAPKENKFFLQNIFFALIIVMMVFILESICVQEKGQDENYQ